MWLIVLSFLSRNFFQLYKCKLQTGRCQISQCDSAAVWGWWSWLVRINIEDNSVKTQENLMKHSSLSESSAPACSVYSCICLSRKLNSFLEASAKKFVSVCPSWTASAMHRLTISPNKSKNTMKYGINRQLYNIAANFFELNYIFRPRN